MAHESGGNPGTPPDTVAPYKPPKDLGELNAAGITPEQLVATADPDLVVVHTPIATRLKLAADHLDKLRALVLQALASPDRASMEATISAVLLGATGTWTAHAHLLLTDEVEYQLRSLGREHGMRRVTDDILTRLKARGRRQGKLLEEAEREASPGVDAPHSLGPAFDGCKDLDPKLLLPPGFEVDTRGVWRLTVGRGGTEHHHILMTPATVASTPVDIDTQELLATLVWRRSAPGTDAPIWDKAQVPLRTLCDGQRLLDLVPRGLYTDGIMAKQVARYLMLTIAVNDSHLARPVCASRCGWLGSAADDKPLACLYGPKLVVPKGAVAPKGGWPTQIALPGLEQLRAAISSRGTARDWCLLFRDLARRYPLAALPTYAAAAAPLLHLLDRPGFVLHLCGDTTGGKTSALRMAASAVGNPAEGDGVLAGWNTSRVGVEARARYLHHLPLILDETTRNPDKRDVARIVLDVCSGHGKVRGTTQVGGLRELATWRLPLISSGNYPLATVTPDAALRSRIIDVHGAPLGESQQEAELMAARIESTILRHHGHALRSIVQHLSEKPPSHWRQAYEQHLATLRSPSASPVEGRLRAYIAVVSLGAELVQAYLSAVLKKDSDLETSRAIELLLSSASDTSNDDPAAAAVSIAYDWAVANQTRFWGRHLIDHTGEPIRHTQGFAGSWAKDPSWKLLAFREAHLEALLSERGHNLKERLTSWRQRGWLAKGEDRHLNPKVRLETGHPRLVAFHRNAIAEAIGLSEHDLAGDSP